MRLAALFKGSRLLAVGVLVAACGNASKPAAPVNRAASAPLPEYICKGDVNAVKRQLEAGVSVETVYQGCSLLQGAATCNQVGVAGLLLERGARPSARNDKGLTALHLATWNGSVAVARLLLERGASVEETTTDGLTALHQAAMASQVEVAKLLLERGAKPDALDQDGRTPLDFAAGQESTGVLRLLLRAGANPLPEREGAPTPLRSAQTVASFELMRDAVWARDAQTKIELPPLLVMSLLQAREADAIACYQAIEPRPPGQTLTFDVQIEANGRVRSAEPALLEAEPREPKLTACVQASLRAISFPGSSTTTSSLVTFQLAPAR